MKSELKALMMKMNIIMESTEGLINFKDRSVYDVARALIRLVEKNQVKAKLKLIKGGSIVEIQK